MAVALNRKIKYKGFRFLLSVLFTVGVLFVCSVAVYAEDEILALNSSGNRNIKLSVDPISKSEGFSAVLYDNRNGMPTSEANAIAQTGDGFIWIGSYAGLIRYDGNTFELISSGTEILNVRCLLVDSRDRLWIGSNDCGVFYMSEGRICKLESSNQQGYASIRSLAEDTEGVIYVGSATGLSAVDSELNLTLVKDVRLDGQTIREIRPGADGIIYGLTSVGDLFTMKNGKLVTFLSHEECRVDDVRCILPDPGHPGCLFLGTEDSQICYGHLENNFSDMDRKTINPLSSAECLEYIDGQIWVCAGNGIGKLDSEGFHTLKNIPMEKTVCHMMTDYEGNMWFTSTRQCVMKIVPNQFLDVFAQYSLPAETVNAVCMFDQKLFLGTDSGLLVLENGKKLNSIPLTKAMTASGAKLQVTDLIKYLDGIRIRSVFLDSRERLWISTWHQCGLVRYDHGNVTVFTEEDGLISDRIRTVSECEDSSMIVACVGGVCIIQDDRIIAAYGERDGITATDILSVTEGFNHEVIVGSDGSGIYVFTPDGKRHIGREEGLTSEIILRIKRSLYQDIYWIITGSSIAFMTPDYRVTTVEDFPFTNNYDIYESSTGYAWIPSSNGIYVASVEEMLENRQINTALYGTSSGLPYLATPNSYSELTPDGDLYIAAVTGLVRVNIEKPFENFSNLKMALPYIDADGVRFYPDQSGDFYLPGNSKKLTLYPYVLSYSLTDPEVSYHLDGFDLRNKTVPRSKLMPVDFTNLKLGTYRFFMMVEDPVGHSEQYAYFRIIKGREMPVGTIGTIIMDASALLLMGGILINSSLYRKRGREEDKLFFHMTLSNMALATGELLSYLLEYSTFPFVKETMILGNTVYYISLVLFPYFLLVYLDYSISSSITRLRKTKLLFGIPCFLFIIVMLMNLSTGWIFSIREGNIYHAGINQWMDLLPMMLVWFYFLFSLIKMAKLNMRLAILGLLLILVRLSWEFWYPWISSTAFMYALLLACTHIHVMNRPMTESMS